MDPTVRATIRVRQTARLLTTDLRPDCCWQRQRNAGGEALRSVSNCFRCVAVPTVSSLLGVRSRCRLNTRAITNW